MANFFKASGMNESGFDKTLVKQAMMSGATAQIALFGGDSDGSPLQVKSNNPGVIELTEGTSPSVDVRAFKIVGKKTGYTMVEARNRSGAVWATLQVHVGGNNSLSPGERVAEAMRRSIPLLPAEAGNAVEALISPESLLTITGTLTLWGGAHFFGVGEIADIILLVLGGIFLGKGVIDLAEALWQFAKRAQSLSEQVATGFHESVHSALSPKFRVFRAFRAGLKASGYWRSALLRFLEESLAESYAMFKTRGLLAAIKAVTFPISNGYVTITQLSAEGTRIGTIALAGGYYGVFWAPHPPAGMPAAPPLPQ